MSTILSMNGTLQTIWSLVTEYFWIVVFIAIIAWIASMMRHGD